jgi:hypothetical protein
MNAIKIGQNRAQYLLALLLDGHEVIFSWLVSDTHDFRYKTRIVQYKEKIEREN